MSCADVQEQAIVRVFQGLAVVGAAVLVVAPAGEPGNKAEGDECSDSNHGFL